MRVLIAFEWFLKLVVEGQALALRERGHEVLLLTRDHALEFGGDAAEREAILGRLRGAGVEVLELTGRRRSPEGIVAAARVRRAVRRWAPDVVSAHENKDPRLLWAVRGAPLVYTVHDPEPHPGVVLGRAERATLDAWQRAAAAIVVHGEELVAPLPAPARERAHVVPHGIAVAPAALPVPQRPAVLLFGRLEPYKGVAVLARAMEDVWAQRPDVRLVVAGRGPAAADVPRGERVELREGYVAEADVPRLLAEASVSVLPYTEASQSGVGLLSVAHGLPTVVTRTGALPGIVPDGRYVAEPGDPASLAQRLLAALDAGAEERERIRAFAASRYGWDVVAAGYERLYAEVIAAAAAANGGAPRRTSAGM